MVDEQVELKEKLRSNPLKLLGLLKNLYGNPAEKRSILSFAVDMIEGK